MTQDEFLHRYHIYCVQDGDEAKREAERANTEGIDGNRAKAIHFGTFGWGLMLETAVACMQEIDDDPMWRQEELSSQSDDK
jgi:hypothetical protein